MKKILFTMQSCVFKRKKFGGIYFFYIKIRSDIYRKYHWQQNNER